MKFIKLLPIVFLLFIACSKSNDPAPSGITEATLLGKWVYKSTTGSITTGGKVVPITNITDESSLFSSTNMVFNSGGKGIYNQGTNDEGQFSYSISGSTVTITDNDLKLALPMAASITNNELTLKADNAAFASILAFLKSYGLIITEANQTVVYTKAV